ncbi:hypothetical protein N0V88_003648 [Collariella sp. IMI 366227]|nr:hypothetical protein N0V88_003648 [Collariella sp. IMI 366227]
MVYPLQPEIADPYDHLKRKACRRISNRWNESIIQEAKGLVMRSPWNLQDLDNNHLVINVRVQLLAGDDDLEPLIEAIVAVMTMTQFYLPRSWNHALQQLPFEKQIPLRAVFDDIEHPERNKRLHKFLATRKPFGERFKGLWSSVVDMFAFEDADDDMSGQIDAIPALTSSLTPALTPVLTIAGILGEELSMPEPAIVKELPMPSPAA